MCQWTKTKRRNHKKHVESLQSHCIHTQFHWSSGPLVCFLSWGTRVQSPGGYLCETGILLLALSPYKYIFSSLRWNNVFYRTVQNAYWAVNMNWCAGTRLNKLVHRIQEVIALKSKCNLFTPKSMLWKG